MKSLISGFCISLLGLTTCFSTSAIGTNRYKLSDPELAPFMTMYDVNREELCLTEIDENAEVEIERDDYTTNGYHIMLHMHSGNVIRTVAFEKVGEKYIWLGEQEIHRSGRNFMTVDGETDEKLDEPYPSNGVLNRVRSKTLGDAKITEEEREELEKKREKHRAERLAAEVCAHKCCAKIITLHTIIFIERKTRKKTQKIAC